MLHVRLLAQSSSTGGESDRGRGGDAVDTDGVSREYRGKCSQTNTAKLKSIAKWRTLLLQSTAISQSQMYKPQLLTLVCCYK